MDSVIGGLRAAIGRGFVGALVVLGVPLGVLLIGLGLFLVGTNVWPRYFPQKSNLSQLQGYVPTTLTERKIWMHADGFVDREVYAMVPMTAEEFRVFVGEQGMVESSDTSVGSPPKWWKHPDAALWRNDRVKGAPQFYLSAHYDRSTRRAYLRYYDT
jgi:hypothetical protein